MRATNDVAPGLNYNAKLTMKKAYGFRTFRGVKIALYHRFGALPEPDPPIPVRRQKIFRRRMTMAGRSRSKCFTNCFSERTAVLPAAISGPVL